MTETGREKAAQKLRYLAETIRHLETFRQMPRAEYEGDPRNELSVERLFQVGLEAVLDVARLVIIEQQLERARETRSEFAILADEQIIGRGLAQYLEQAKGFRNVLVHDYVSIEREQVYRSLQSDLDDLRRFVQAMAAFIQKQDSQRDQ